MTNIIQPDDAQKRIVEAIKVNPIVLFMKGTVSHPQCGFSAAVVEALAHYGVPVHAVDVLTDPPIRQAIKKFSDWPTIPQLYVDGAFIGGCDIVLEMLQTGELAEVLGTRRAAAAS
jgi:monothiol glutaredoxin